MNNNKLHDQLRDLVESFDKQFNTGNFMELTDFIGKYDMYHLDVELIRSYYAKIADNKELEKSYPLYYVENALPGSQTFKSILIAHAIKANDTELVFNYLSSLKEPEKLDNAFCRMAERMDADAILDIFDNYGIDCTTYQYQFLQSFFDYWKGE